VCTSSQPKIQTFIAEETDEKRIGPLVSVWHRGQGTRAYVYVRMYVYVSVCVCVYALTSPVDGTTERLLLLNDEINNALAAYRALRRGDLPHTPATATPSPARRPVVVAPSKATATPTPPPSLPYMRSLPYAGVCHH
jgi:hypothetical protein